LHDYGCSLKAFKKEIIEDIKLYGELHRFLPVLANIEGARIKEIKLIIGAGSMDLVNMELIELLEF